MMNKVSSNYSRLSKKLNSANVNKQILICIKEFCELINRIKEDFISIEN